MLATVSTLLFAANAIVEENSAPILDRIQHLQALARPDELEQAEAKTLKVTWSDCGGSSALGKVTSLEPSVMTMGETTHMIGKGTLKEAVTGGTFVMKVDAGILRKTFRGNICKSNKFKLSMLGIDAGTIGFEAMECPSKAGPITVKMTNEISASLPRGMARATITLHATSSSGKELMCVEVKTE